MDDIEIVLESEIKNEKGFELEHGCGVFFDLFHSCSCKQSKQKKKNLIISATCSILFFYYLAVKGRFKDYYRYGQVRSCMPYWNDFFLCMRLKLETDPLKAQVRNKSIY